MHKLGFILSPSSGFYKSFINTSVPCFFLQISSLNPDIGNWKIVNTESNKIIQYFSAVFGVYYERSRDVTRGE